MGLHADLDPSAFALNDRVRIAAGNWPELVGETGRVENVTVTLRGRRIYHVLVDGHVTSRAMFDGELEPEDA